jgi:hypothetical protein
MVQGRLMRGFLAALERDRARNAMKAKWLRRSYWLVCVGLGLVSGNEHGRRGQGRSRDHRNGQQGSDEAAPREAGRASRASRSFRGCGLGLIGLRKQRIQIRRRKRGSAGTLAHGTSTFSRLTANTSRAPREGSNELRLSARPGAPARGGQPERHVKPRTGCSSIPFGATPVWPWKKSKKVTPVTRARRHGRAALRATRICVRRTAAAPLVQSGEGVSAIIVRAPLRRTRWWSRSASARSSVTAATTVKTRRSKGSRLFGRWAGRGRLVRCATVAGRAGRRSGLSFSVLTDQRSTPQESAAEKPTGCAGAGAATRAVTAATSARTTTIEARFIRSRLRRAGRVPCLTAWLQRSSAPTGCQPLTQTGQNERDRPMRGTAS